MPHVWLKKREIFTPCCLEYASVMVFSEASSAFSSIQIYFMYTFPKGFGTRFLDNERNWYYLRI